MEGFDMNFTDENYRYLHKGDLIMSLIEDCQTEHTKKLRKIFEWAKNDEDKETLKRMIRANRVLEEGLDEDATSGYRKLINDITDFRRVE